MTKARYLAGCWMVSVSVFSCSVLLISACSRKPETAAQTGTSTATPQPAAAPAQTEPPTAIAQISPTPAPPEPADDLWDCSDKKRDKGGTLARWLKRSKEEDQLYLYAVKLFKQPISCRGNVTDGDENDPVATMVLTFANGATFSIDTGEMRATQIQLRSPEGFPDEKEARSALEQFCQEHGANINWSKAETASNNGEQTTTYMNQEKGLNIGADLIFKDKKLVEIGYHSVD